jgi:hypothetical protein
VTEESGDGGVWLEWSGMGGNHDGDRSGNYAEPLTFRIRGQISNITFTN